MATDDEIEGLPTWTEKLRAAGGMVPALMAEAAAARRAAAAAAGASRRAQERLHVALQAERRLKGAKARQDVATTREGFREQVEDLIASVPSATTSDGEGTP